MTQAPPPHVAPPPSSDGIARRFLKLRVAILLILSALLLRLILEEVASLRAAANAAEAQRVARALAEAVVLGGRERGLVALRASGGGEQHAEAIARLRQDTDGIFQGVADATRRLARERTEPILTRAVEDTMAARTRFLAARARIDASGSLGSASEVSHWIVDATQYQETLLWLYHEVLDSPVGQSTSLRDLSRLRELSLDAVEHAGQERALVASALARGATLSSVELADLQRRQGVAIESLERLDKVVSARKTADQLDGAIAEVQRTFLVDLAPMRDQALACASGRSHCSFTAEEWFVQASLGVDAIAKLSSAAEDMATREIAQVQRNARVALAAAAGAGALSLALIAVAGAFVRRRIIRRLTTLRDDAMRVAGGALDHPVTRTGRDEISEVAGAVEQMRAAVGARNQELRDLVGQLQEAQDRVVQQERLASVGRLAAGVAHEINNPLAVVIGNVAHLRSTLEEPPSNRGGEREELREVLQEVQQAAERAGAIVRDLRDFAAIGPGSADGIENLDSAVRDVATTLRTSLPEGVRLELDLHAPVGVEAPPMALVKVLKRLVDNAREACSAGGTITLRTRESADHVEMAVVDTGRGIAPEHLARVFEPFFTTKRLGAGTGLGLSVCLGLVRQHAGDVTIDSTVGVGTTVTVSLPRARPRP